MSNWKNPTFQGQDEPVRSALRSLGQYIDQGYPTFAARGWRSAALSVAGAIATTLVAMDQESWDYNNNFDTSTGRYTAPIAGVYDVSGAVSINLNSNPDEFELNVYVNAAIASSGQRAVVRGGAAGDDWNFVVSDSILLVAGDLVDLRVDHLQGGNAAALNTGSAHCYLTIRRVGN